MSGGPLAFSTAAFSVWLLWKARDYWPDFWLIPLYFPFKPNPELKVRTALLLVCFRVAKIQHELAKSERERENQRDGEFGLCFKDSKAASHTEAAGGAGRQRDLRSGLRALNAARTRPPRPPAWNLLLPCENSPFPEQQQLQSNCGSREL